MLESITSRGGVSSLLPVAARNVGREEEVRAQVPVGSDAGFLSGCGCRARTDNESGKRGFSETSTFFIEGGFANLICREDRVCMDSLLEEAVSSEPVSERRIPC